VKRVIRGRAKVDDAIPHRGDYCDALFAGKEYLVVTPGAEEGRVRVTSQTFAPRMLEYLERAHRETHERVLAKTIAWCEHAMSQQEFRDWITTVAVKHRSQNEDEYLLRLIGALDNTSSIVGYMPAGVNVDAEMRELVKLARVFPRGTPEKFDDRLEASGDREAPARAEYDMRLMRALDRVRDAAMAKTPRTW